MGYVNEFSTLSEIKCINKEEATKILQDLNIQIPEQGDLEFLRSNLRSFKLRLDSDMNLSEILTDYKSWLVQKQAAQDTKHISFQEPNNYDTVKFRTRIKQNNITLVETQNDKFR